VRLLFRWAINALALYGIAYVAPELGMLPGFTLVGFEAAAFAVAILAVLNLTIRPIIKLLTLPITCLTFGLFALVINALMMFITAELVRGFDLGQPAFLNAVIASVIFAILTAIANTLLFKED
jgi:putative membrane protein